MSDLVNRLDEIRRLLLARATDGVGADDARYTELRRELLLDPKTKDRLPECVRACRQLDDFWPFITKISGTGTGSWAERRGYLGSEFTPLLDALEAEGQGEPCDDEIVESLSVLDSAHVARAWERARERRGSDPAAAITAARSLVETVCKHVLDDFGETYARDASVPELYAACARKLGVHPEGEPEPKLKQFYSACAKVAAAVGELRNLLGDAHGPAADARLPDESTASLAVNLAGSLAAFVAARVEQRG